MFCFIAVAGISSYLTDKTVVCVPLYFIFVKLFSLLPAPSLYVHVGLPFFFYTHQNSLPTKENRSKGGGSSTPPTLQR